MAKQSVLIPVVVFAGIVVLLWFGFQLSDPHLLPSEKIDEPIPEFELPNPYLPAAQAKMVEGHLRWLLGF